VTSRGRRRSHVKEISISILPTSISEEKDLTLTPEEEASLSRLEREKQAQIYSRPPPSPGEKRKGLSSISEKEEEKDQGAIACNNLFLLERRKQDFERELSVAARGKKADAFFVHAEEGKDGGGMLLSKGRERISLGERIHSLPQEGYLSIALSKGRKGGEAQLLRTPEPAERLPFSRGGRGLNLRVSFSRSRKRSRRLPLLRSRLEKSSRLRQKGNDVGSALHLGRSKTSPLDRKKERENGTSTLSSLQTK